ncbi:MAG: hypothetical protein PW735_05050, partial [Acidobacteriaceae bacterium]|nr:hypothetical protein [Acidobacteriaceae bacterium]
MIDGTQQNAGWQQQPKPKEDAAGAYSQAAGYCQDCGRPLNTETVRVIGSSIFCEPCLQARISATPSPAASMPPGSMPAGPGEPSPVIAGLLGMIPGVGAMYNGQFAKGIAHIAVFAVLISLANQVNSIFSLGIFGWWAYMVFDAIHTARARRDGTPLPNMFGLNDIGERLGMGKNSAA